MMKTFGNKSLIVKILAISDQFFKVLSANVCFTLISFCINAQSTKVFAAKHVLGTNPPTYGNYLLYYL